MRKKKSDDKFGVSLNVAVRIYYGDDVTRSVRKD